MNNYLEYERLKALFLSVDSSKADLVDELIKQAAFMKVELVRLNEIISKTGLVQVSKSGSQRQTESAKYYTKLVNTYATVIKTLNGILQKNVKDEDDEFDDFMKRLDT